MTSAIGHATATPEASAQLADFARACKAAARAVLLYPAAHPAVAASLQRLVDLTSARALLTPLRITVLADRLLVDGQPPTRTDPAVTELAALLHDHSIGELTVIAGGDADAWRSFLLLLGRKPEAVRADGGISRLSSTSGGRHVEIREIDYAEVLREDRGDSAAAWEHIVTTCLQGSAARITAEALRDLLEGGFESVTRIIESLQAHSAATGCGVGPTVAALARLFHSIVDAVAQHAPERAEGVLQSLADASGRLTPDMLAALVAASRETGQGNDPGGSGATPATGTCAAVNAVLSHMSERTLARFVATHAPARGDSLESVALAFRALVPNPADRNRVLDLAHDNLQSSQAVTPAAFDGMWRELVERLLSDSADRPAAAAAPVAAVPTEPMDVEEVGDDPPSRIAAWLATLSPDELRRLDGLVILDLLRIESEHHRWTALLAAATALLEDLCLVGDFGAACEVLSAIVRHPGSHGEGRRDAVTAALDGFIAGPAIRHLVAQLVTIDEGRFDRVTMLCTMTGAGFISPLAEALAAEDRPAVRKRLTAIVIAYGASGRHEVERLKSSPNAAVRRAAIHLLRESGGSDALPELTELLDDSAPQVQREAVRAILDIGTDPAYGVLERALVSGTPRSREAIMQAVSTVRDERATPLLAHIVRHVDCRGSLRSIYLRALDALAALKDPAGVPILNEALHRGQWWAPRRTALLRSAAAAALARLGTAEAVMALEEAAQSGSRGVRHVARSHLRALAATRPVRGAA